MPETKDFLQRIEMLDQCLRNNYKNWTLDDLINAVNDNLAEIGKGISRRTIQDDLKHMSTAMDAPIAKRKSGSVTYFYYTDANFSIKNLPLNDEEVGTLTDAINILREVNSFKILDEVDATIKKLQSRLSSNESNSVPIIQFEKHTVSAGTHHIDNFYSAIKAHQPLQIQYKPFHEPLQEYIFHPYLIKEYRNRWFVIGRKHDEKKVTVIALDRLEKAKTSGADFQPNDLFDIPRYEKDLIGVTIPNGKKVEPIILKIAPRQAPYIKTKPIHFTQTIINEEPNGGLQIQLNLIVNYELQSVILSYGCDVEVISPGQLRQEIKEIITQSCQVYNM